MIFPIKNRPLRIALTVDPEIPVPPKYYGGIERIVDLLARHLTKRGYLVTLFASADSTCPVERVAWPGKRSNSRSDMVRNSATLSRRVLAGQFDLVHSFSRIAYMTPFLPLSVPKLMSYQREISSKTTGRALMMARGTLEFSAIAQHMLRQAPLQGRWHLVPNGVPIDTFVFRENVSPNAPLVFLGRVEAIKGPHLAIEAAHRSGRRLVIAGNIPPEHQGWYETYIAPYVDGVSCSYIGPVDDRQKSDLLGSAAALLMPILWEEPFGIVMAEAMACGTPVIGLRRGSVSEVVEDGVTGFVCSNMEEFVTMVGRIGELSRVACRHRVERLYSEDAIVTEYERVYADMLSRIGRSRPRTPHSSDRTAG